MWRSRWPFNYGELIKRVLLAAPVLKARRPSTVVVAVQPRPELPLPPFVGQVFRALGYDVSPDGWPPTALAGHTFEQPTVCCVNNVPFDARFEPSAVNHVRLRLAKAAAAAGSRAHWPWTDGRLTGARAAAARGQYAGERPRLLLLQRMGEAVALAATAAPGSRPASAGGGEAATRRAPLRLPPRTLVSAAALLAGCRHSGRRCGAVSFEGMPFLQVLATVRAAHALVGVHGAGLANAAFMREGSTLVEILPRAFGSLRRSFGTAAYAYMNELGVVRHERILGAEADPNCVRVARKHRAGVAERLRDCSVNVTWSEVARALARASEFSRAEDGGAFRGGLIMVESHL